MKNAKQIKLMLIPDTCYLIIIKGEALKILVTGGAGFIGSRVARVLAELGHQVRVLDNLSPQVHEEAAFPAELTESIECIKADLRDRDAVQHALEGIEVVAHLAAETGTGQSMYRIRHYSDVNTTGTAGLLDIIVNEPNSVRRIVLSSSRAVYGEGPYNCPNCGIVYPPSRSISQLAAHEWEMNCPRCGQVAIASVPTTEEALLQPQSIYASTKQSQEQLVSITTQARELEAVILRYQNVYGPGQALTNPYTGVICAFFSSIIQGKTVTLFEDGEISRDFVFIDDVVNATVEAIIRPEIGAPQPLFLNVGMGARTTIREVAQTLYETLELPAQIEVSGQYRLGDVRHCYADVTRLEQQLGYTPQFSFVAGIRQFVEWALTQRDMIAQSPDRLEQAKAELIARNLFRN